MTIQEEVRQGLGAWYAALPQAAIVAAENALRQVNTEVQGGACILPNREDIFRAFQLTTPQNIKFVLVGQDPYPTTGHAMGLAFSVRQDVKPFPRSLQNIFRELHSDLGIPVPATGDLSVWAQQGGLLLNTSLTVEAGKANSHRDIGWGSFTRRVLDYVAGLPQPLVFLQWGMQAVKTTPAAALDRTDRAFIRSTHPSPLAANRASKELPAFIGSHPFSRTNEALQRMRQKLVDWRLE